MKDAYILYKIKDIQAKIKEAQNKGDMELIFDLMKQNAHLNEIKNVLCKELGERIVIKNVNKKTSMNFLETENVVKQYAGHLALNKVSIQVPTRNNLWITGA